MSFLSGMLIGAGFLTSPYCAIPALTYNQVRLNGGATIDKVRVLRRHMTEDEMDDLAINDTYSWESDTLLLYSEFTNDYEAGFITSGGSWSGYKISRIASDENKQKVIASGLSKDTKEYWDYYTENGKTYTYIVAPITSESVLTSFQSDPVTVSYDDVFLVDPTTGEYYKFSLNVDVGDITTTTGETKYENGNTQYPTFSQDNQMYDSGTITALMGYMSGNTYVDTSSYLKDLKAFINNKREKILKGIKDSMLMKVKTSNFSYKPDRATGSTNVTFSFTEVGGID